MFKRIPTGFFALWVLGGLLSITSATEVIISELMYNPAAGQPEYIELQNLTASPLDIARWECTDGVDYTFPDFSALNPEDTFLEPFERILLSPVDETTLRAAYPSIPPGTRIFGPYSGSLDDGGERVTVKDKNGVGVTTVSYDDTGRWPAGPDGTGHSLVVINSDRVVDDYRNWRTSYVQQGTPGADPASPGLLHDKVQFSELEFSTSNTVLWVEVYNASQAPLSASGLWIASGTSLSNKVALSGSVPGTGYASWDVNLPLDGGDAVLFLIDGSDVVIDAIDLDVHATRNFAQTLPAGSDEWYSSSTGTRDTVNDPDRTTDIVINELMIDPVSQSRDGEYIELVNRGGAPLDIGGWELEGAVDFSFPLNTIIPAGGYLVVAANLDYFTTVYGGGINALGNLDGQLENDGELLHLKDNEGNLA
ncbi:MAG: lamin tail domain-containing protein, partial [Verrucomicrobiota bacterium]